MKTPIQQLMTELNELHPNLLNVHTHGGREFVNTVHKYLAVEREHLINAVDQTIAGIKLDEDKSGFIAQDGEGYFKETYESNP
jgi:hypothetical protein